MRNKEEQKENKEQMQFPAVRVPILVMEFSLEFSMATRLPNRLGVLVDSIAQSSRCLDPLDYPIVSMPWQTRLPNRFDALIQSIAQSCRCLDPLDHPIACPTVADADRLPVPVATTKSRRLQSDPLPNTVGSGSQHSGPEVVVLLAEPLLA